MAAVELREVTVKVTLSEQPSLGQAGQQVTLLPGDVYPDDATFPVIRISPGQAASFTTTLRAGKYAWPGERVYFNQIMPHLSYEERVSIAALRYQWHINSDPVSIPQDAETVDVILTVEPACDLRIACIDGDQERLPYPRLWSASSGREVRTLNSHSGGDPDLHWSQNLWRSASVPSVPRGEVLEVWAFAEVPGVQWAAPSGIVRRFSRHVVPPEVTAGNQSAFHEIELPGPEMVLQPVALRLRLLSFPPNDNLNDFSWSHSRSDFPILLVATDRSNIFQVEVPALWRDENTRSKIGEDIIEGGAYLVDIPFETLVPPGEYDVLFGNFDQYFPHALERWLAVPVGESAPPVYGVPRIVVSVSDDPAVVHDLGVFDTGSSAFAVTQAFRPPLGRFLEYPEYLPGQAWFPELGELQPE